MAKRKRFILLGLDGHNPEMVERFLPDLPAMRGLIETGTFGPALPTVPVDTPTNWTTIATGATAATHHITGFAYHRPGHSLTEAPGPNKDYAERRAAEFLWEAADRQGKVSILLNYPFAWYSDAPHAVIIGGDQIVGGRCQITPGQCFATRDRTGAVEATPIEMERDGQTWRGQIVFSPDRQEYWSATGLVTDPGGAGDAQSRTTVDVVAGPGSALSIRHNGRELARLSAGQWSDWVELPFLDEPGLLRFYLEHLDTQTGSLQLVHTMVVRKTGWSRPDDVAARLVAEAGPYAQGLETGGQREAWGWFGKQPDLAHLVMTGELTCQQAATLTRAYPDWDHLYVQLHSTDGLNHRKLGLMAEGHPRSTPALRREVEAWYRDYYVAADRIVGEVADLAQAHDAVLVVVADHSAIPTHTWVDTSAPFEKMDWLNFDASINWWDPATSRVRFMINHSAYVNLKGRQPDGIVEPADYERTRDTIIHTLLGLRDPRTGECPIALAARREDLAPLGVDDASFGDVVYLMRPGYTNQPADEAGKLPDDRLARVVEDVDQARRTGFSLHKTIQGNHHDDLPWASWPGFCANWSVLLLNGPGVRRGHRLEGARLVDVAPTLAAVADVTPPAQAEGRVLTDALAG